ncbi:tetratricopeptide (TPR) repeat protein [Bradyrhizobium sp. USDA 4509]
MRRHSKFAAAAVILEPTVRVVFSGLFVLASLTCESLAAYDAQTINQRTYGPCSQAIAAVDGPVNIKQNCVLISFTEFVDNYRKTESELRQRGMAGDVDALTQANALRRKLDDPDELYAAFATAARKYLGELDAIENDIGFGTVREAAVGKAGAQKTIIDGLASKGKTMTALSYVVRLGELLEAQGNLSGAATVYDEAIRTLPPSGEILRRNASVLIELSKTSSAIAMLEAALKTDDKQQKLTPADLANIYSALGEAYQDIGKLDTAIDRFRMAKQLARSAVRDGSLAQVQYASILNDSAGPAIRSGNFSEAQESLCAALASYKSSNSNERDAITSELNLAVVLRELGRWGDAKLVLQHTINRIAQLPSNDPFRGFLPLFAGILDYLSGDDAAAFNHLQEAQDFFEPAYKQSRAYSLRLGRIYDIRGRIRYRNGDLAGAASAFAEAGRLFEGALGDTSIDGSIVNFWSALVALEAQDTKAGEANSKSFENAVSKLNLSDGPWQSYREFLGEAAQIATYADKQRPAKLENALDALFHLEQSSGAYDITTDAAIIFLLRLPLKAPVKLSTSDVDRFRAERGARRGTSLATAKTFDEICATYSQK